LLRHPGPFRRDLHSPFDDVSRWDEIIIMGIWP
jgi:hypothetical protein